MELKTQAQLAEELFKKTMLHFDRISEEDSLEFIPPTEQSVALIGKMKSFNGSFVEDQEGEDISLYYSFFQDGSWLVFDETGKTQAGVCLKKEKVFSEALPEKSLAKFLGKKGWEITS
jgi:hypothetical protein